MVVNIILSEWILWVEQPVWTHQTLQWNFLHIMIVWVPFTIIFTSLLRLRFIQQSAKSDSRIDYWAWQPLQATRPRQEEQSSQRHPIAFVQPYPKMHLAMVAAECDRRTGRLPNLREPCAQRLGFILLHPVARGFGTLFSAIQKRLPLNCRLSIQQKTLQIKGLIRIHQTKLKGLAYAQIEAKILLKLQ